MIKFCGPGPTSIVSRTELDEISSYAVKKQVEKNPAACIWRKGVLIGKIWDSRRRGYKELKYM